MRPRPTFGVSDRFRIPLSNLKNSLADRGFAFLDSGVKGSEEKPKIRGKVRYFPALSKSSGQRSSSTRKFISGEDFRIGLTYDDVLLVPKYSGMGSRHEADISTHFSRKISIRIPLLSANMDTVTEAEMAVALAREGGLGIIHRFMTLEEQVAQVQKVKRMESIIIESPYSLGSGAKISEVKNMMDEKNVGGILIVEKDSNVLAGIVTTRDLRFWEDMEEPVTKVMTGKKDLVTSIWGRTSIEEARKIMEDTKIEKLPLVDSQGRLKGLVTAKDILKRKEFPNATKDAKGRLRVGAAIGVKGDYLERAKSLANVDVDVLVLDIAHGHSAHAIEAIKKIKKNVEVELVAGNVATSEGAKDLIRAGADSIKVGVGSGSICITRIVTGSGVPQLTAVMDCSKVAIDEGVTLIADGGIRSSGDIAKAIVAGADSVMVGSLLAGTDESPGEIVLRRNHRYKVTRGMASLAARKDRLAREGMEGDPDDYVPEGVEAIVPYKGSAVNVIHQLAGGLRSGLSYCGANNLEEMKKNGEFIKITEGGLAESGAHDVITEF